MLHVYYVLNNNNTTCVQLPWSEILRHVHIYMYRQFCNEFYLCRIRTHVTYIYVESNEILTVSTGQAGNSHLTMYRTIRRRRTRNVFFLCTSYYNTIITRRAVRLKTIHVMYSQGAAVLVVGQLYIVCIYVYTKRVFTKMSSSRTRTVIIISTVYNTCMYIYI